MTRLLEQDRRQYLAAMGIHVWARRSPLASAGSVHLGALVAPAADAVAEAAPVVAARVAAVEPAETSLPSPAGQSAPLSLPANASRSEAAAESTAKPQRLTELIGTNQASSLNPSEHWPDFPIDDQPQIRLWLHQLGPWLLVDAVPLHLNERQRQDLHQLAQAMLRACWHHSYQSAEMPGVHHQYLEWPVFAHPRIDQSSQKALGFFRHKIQAALLTGNVQAVMLCGQQAQQYVLAQVEPQWLVLGHCYDLPSANLPSLSQLLGMPAEKAECWQLMQALLATSASAVNEA